MNEQFKIGEIVILECDPAATPNRALLRLRGEEVEVVGPLELYETEIGEIYLHAIWHASIGLLWAAPHELRRKRPPTTGEDMIRAMFDTPPVERRRPVTAWQAQYDTAQALMAMGVRVKPGKWPVEVA